MTFWGACSQTMGRLADRGQSCIMTWLRQAVILHPLSLRHFFPLLHTYYIDIARCVMGCMFVYINSPRQMNIQRRINVNVLQFLSENRKLTSTYQLRSTLPCFIMFLSANCLRKTRFFCCAPELGYFPFSVPRCCGASLRQKNWIFLKNATHPKFRV